MSIAPDLTITTRIAAMAPSAVAAVQEQIRQAQLGGRKILPLASGDPNIPTHPYIIEAAQRALADGDTHYIGSAGQPSLREALAARLSQRCGMHYGADDIVVTPGATFGLVATMMAIVEPGSEVILLDPCWVSYADQVRLCGGVPVRVPAINGVDPDRLASEITDRTRMILVNSPVNPTGRVLPAAELRAIVALAERHKLWLLFDQVHAAQVYDDTQTPFAWLQAREGAYERTVVVDSLSKTYGMSGWRVGYVAAPAPMASTILKVVQHGLFCTQPFIQAAAEAALQLPDSVTDAHMAEFKARRDMAVERLNRLPGIHCQVPQSAFYLFPEVHGNEWDVARDWLENAGVATMPGSIFGPAGKGHLRLSIAIDRAVLDDALTRIERHVGLLRLMPSRS